MLLVLYGYLPLGMLEWGNGKLSPDGVCARHVAYSIKQAGESSLQGDDVLGHCIGWECLNQLGI